jgi:hypothetical protein
MSERLHVGRRAACAHQNLHRVSKSIGCRGSHSAVGAERAVTGRRDQGATSGGAGCMDPSAAGVYCGRDKVQGVRACVPRSRGGAGRKPASSSSGSVVAFAIDHAHHPERAINPTSGCET